MGQTENRRRLKCGFATRGKQCYATLIKVSPAAPSLNGARKLELDLARIYRTLVCRARLSNEPKPDQHLNFFFSQRTTLVPVWCLLTVPRLQPHTQHNTEHSSFPHPARAGTSRRRRRHLLQRARLPPSLPRPPPPLGELPPLSPPPPRSSRLGGAEIRPGAGWSHFASSLVSNPSSLQ